MKNNISLAICFIILMLTGCYDRDIIDAKPGEPIDPVTNLNYTIDGSSVALTWVLPAQYPDDIILPVSVMIKVYQDDILKSTVTAADAPTSYIYGSYNADISYRFIVKVVGNVDTEDPNVAKTRYSLGEFVIIP
jgi:hypothetical protein